MMNNEMKSSSSSIISYYHYVPNLPIYEQVWQFDISFYYYVMSVSTKVVEVDHICRCFNFNSLALEEYVWHYSCCILQRGRMPNKAAAHDDSTSP